MYRCSLSAINLCGFGENFSNTNKPTIKQPREHQYRFNSDLSIGKVLWRNVRANTHNELKVQLGKFFQFIQRRITRDSFKR